MAVVSQVARNFPAKVTEFLILYLFRAGNSAVPVQMYALISQATAEQFPYIVINLPQKATETGFEK